MGPLAADLFEFLKSWIVNTEIALMIYHELWGAVSGLLIPFVHVGLRMLPHHQLVLRSPEPLRLASAERNFSVCAMSLMLSCLALGQLKAWRADEVSRKHK